MFAKINPSKTFNSNTLSAYSSSVNIGILNSGNATVVSSILSSALPPGISVLDLNELKKAPDFDNKAASLQKQLSVKKFLKILFELAMAFAGYKIMPTLKSKVSDTNLVSGVSGLKEKYINPKSQNLNEQAETFFGFKIDLSNPFDVIKQFIGLDLNNSVVGLIGGYGLGALLVRLFDNLTKNINLPSSETSFPEKKVLKKSFFDKFVDFSIKLISSLTVANWVHSKIKNPFVEFGALVLGYGIGEGIALFDEFLKNKIYQSLGPPLEKLTGTKLKEEDDPKQEWNFAASLARSIALAILVFIKYIVFLPKKKFLFYQAQYEPLKKTKNDFLLSTNNHLKLQVVPSANIKPAKFDPEAIPSQNIEYTYEWLDSISAAIKQEKKEKLSLVRFFSNAYLKHLKMVMNTVRSPKFTEVASRESSSTRDKTVALIQDSGRNILYKFPLSFLIVFYGTAAEFVLHLLNPLWDSLKSLFKKPFSQSVS
ncbi:MAG: hypothetical protein SFU25_02310 [Candidatus Caenarcaniphilales bacterium]|nr:hypothetical protein [Candidatus Caenarcaniphilales bacterium]